MIEEEIERLEREYADLDEVWQAEKAQVVGTQHIKEEIDKVKLQMEEAKRKGDWQAVSELQYGKLPQLRRAQKADSKLASEQGAKPRLLRTQVGAEEIAEVVSRSTGIPVSKMLQGEREKLLHMEDALHRRVVGQTRRSGWSPTRSAARARGCPTRIDRTDRFSSSARLASARPSCARLSPVSCSIPSSS
jgi:ATP-dependent Clp protease ATP-binding subunit ClpB